MIQGKEKIGYYIREQINRLRKQEIVKQNGLQTLTHFWDRNKRATYNEQIKRYQTMRVCWTEILNILIKEGIAE